MTAGGDFKSFIVTRPWLTPFFKTVSWEEPVLGLFDSPPGTQDLQEFRRKHNVPVLLPFTLLDPDSHALAVDRGRCKCDGHAFAKRCGEESEETAPRMIA